MPGTPEVKGINLSDLQATDSRRKKSLAGGPPLKIGGSPGQIFNSAQTVWKIEPPALIGRYMKPSRKGNAPISKPVKTRGDIAQNAPYRPAISIARRDIARKLKIFEDKLNAKYPMILDAEFDFNCWCWIAWNFSWLKHSSVLE